MITFYLTLSKEVKTWKKKKNDVHLKEAMNTDGNVDSGGHFVNASIVACWRTVVLTYEEIGCSDILSLRLLG